MSHILLDEAIVPVPTEHGDIHVTTGHTRCGDQRVVLVAAGPEDTDVHLTWRQAVQLAATLVDASTKITTPEGNLL